MGGRLLLRSDGNTISKRVRLGEAGITASGSTTGVIAILYPIPLFQRRPSEEEDR